METMSDVKHPTDPMERHWRRFWFALTNPFTRTPEKVGGDKRPRHRLGIVDLTHAFTNLFVEASRALPYRSGHRYMWAALTAIVSVVLLLMAIAALVWTLVT